MALDEIWDNIYVGNIVDAKTFQGVICCVLEQTNPDVLEGNVREDAHMFPILDTVYGEVNMAMIELLAQFAIRTRRGRPNTKILIHCGAGVERSPLAVAYVIFRAYRGDFRWFTEAYEMVKRKHPDTRDRSNWIPDWVRRMD